ncbi:MAG: Asp-tRNA(Asn)/Glu-tRNA(Gln) amidotransferase subunit GatA [bacterium]
MKLNQLTIQEARQKLDQGEITAVDLTQACLDRIKAVNGKIHACLATAEASALVEAKTADKKIQAGQTGPLLGIPYLLKDNILAKGLQATAGSKMLENYIAPYDATVVKRLKKSGAILLGKTNLDEFAHGASTEYSAFGPTHNPWDLRRVPGGSSGGSAAAVATDMCLFALGTDTGGSIRHPAALCGVVGYKPSYGLCSRFGLIAMTSSTDVPGPLTKTVEDTVMVLSVIAGQDKQDSTTTRSKAVALETRTNLSGIRLGVPKEYFINGLSEGVDKRVKEAIVELKKAGAEIVNVSLPHTKYGVSVYYIITPCEISSNLARFDGLRFGRKGEAKDLLEYYAQTRGQGFGPEVKRRIMLGTYALSSGYYDAYYLQAQKVRTKIAQDFEKVFQQVDALITPTTPQTAFVLGQQDKDPLKMYLEDIFLTPSSLAGLPAISVPGGLFADLPVGLQFIGPKLGDSKLLTIASFYDKLSKRLVPEI